MGFLDEVKTVATDLKDEFDDTTDPYDRLEMRFVGAGAAVVALIVAVGLIVLLANVAVYLIPGLLVAGGLYWYFTRYNKGDKDNDKPDFRKN